MVTKRTDQTRERRQFRIKMSVLDDLLVASGDLQAAALKNGDKLSAVIVGTGKLGQQELIITRDRVTERVVPDAEPET